MPFKSVQLELLVFTKATDIHFCALWLAPVTRDIRDYQLILGPSPQRK